MRISDWSSDVCSSDLRDHRLRYTIVESEVPLNDYVAEVALKPVTDGNRTFRSEERRVGKECVRTCRSRWSPYHSKQKQKDTDSITHHTVSSSAYFCSIQDVH